ncbi:PAAR domain-containing protein [Polyangium aurulentum]|uniref:PAAR domain-containing protein n=1 Tax=Polyangium aurulentum TaxID=2567896 RepID=UPI0010AE6264|nr:PAAR domain-containing protein [Polyangium aurulentum]UQA60660.1 PAAR domain-containing protein [Polyangium aurulentum]
MPAAARIGDTHRCSYHVGGRIITGCPTVLIRGKPAARATDVAECKGPEEDAIEEGCATVLIGCKRAARVLDRTDGGELTSGEPTVQIGPAASPVAIKRAMRKLRKGRRGQP